MRYTVHDMSTLRPSAPDGKPAAPALPGQDQAASRPPRPPGPRGGGPRAAGRPPRPPGPGGPARRPGVGVLARSVALLELLADGPQPLRPLAEASGLPRPTAHRLLVALENHGLVART